MLDGPVVLDGAVVLDGSIALSNIPHFILGSALLPHVLCMELR